MRFQNGSRLQKILSFAFASTAIDSFRASPDLKEIHSLAFYNCANLALVALDENITYLGELCFLNTALKNVYLPPVLDTSNEELGVGQHFDNVYVVPDGTSTITSGTVNNANNVVVVPNSVTKLSENAFKGHANLKRIVF